MKFVSVYARLLALVIAGQFYAAGLAIFGATSFVPHAIIGWSFILLSTILMIAALVSRGRRLLWGQAAAVWLLSILQPVIVFGLRRWPPAAALHPLAGLVIAGLLVAIARRASASDT